MNAIIGRGMLAASLLFGLQALATPITTTLRLKERVSMEQLAQNVQNPASEHYGRFYTPEEIREVSAPSNEEYNGLIAGLQAQGLTIVSESPTHLWLTVSGEQSIYESLFATQIQPLHNGSRKQMYSVRVPFFLSLVQGVTGLDNTRKAHPHYIKQATLGLMPGGVQPGTIKSAYGFNPIYAAGITAQGIDIAIATYDGLNIDNIRQYYKLINLSPVPNVDQVAFNGVAKYDENSAAETELDGEFAGMIAVGANIHVFASATNDDAGELQMYTAILDDNRAKVVNYSWGSCETQVTAQHKAEMDPIFSRAAAQGVNITVASGDSGSDSCQDGTVKADWPSAHAGVISVGGTTLSTSSGHAMETGWNGSGGGISELWDLPAYQQGLGAPFTKRSYPDVAFNASPNSGQAIYTGAPGKGQWMIVGGTSMAAPQWAGFLALVGSARKAMGKSSVGFLNPIIYGMDTTTRAATFHDVTSGSNGAYSSKAGWDAVTGWGSMQADTLLNYLKTL
ncbi:MAG: S53 family peptidase [Bdellovibrionales bacterium]